MEHAVEFAQRLADTVSPTSMATMKAQMWNHPQLTLEEATRQSNALMNSSTNPGIEHFTEGVQSFMQKRNPNFKPLNKRNPVMEMGKNFFSKNSDSHIPKNFGTPYSTHPVVYP